MTVPEELIVDTDAKIYELELIEKLIRNALKFPRHEMVAEVFIKELHSAGYSIVRTTNATR